MATRTRLSIACMCILRVLLSLIPMLTQASRGFRIKQFREILKELQQFCDEILHCSSHVVNIHIVIYVDLAAVFIEHFKDALSWIMFKCAGPR